MIEKRRLLDRSREEVRSQQPIKIPIDLTMEILSRLPPKSIVRFGCVSKLWSSLTKLPSFNNMFMSRPSSKRPHLLVIFSTGVKQYCILFPQHQNPNGSYPPLHSFQIEKINDPKYSLSQSVQGMILLRGFNIWNPTLRRLSALPSVDKHDPNQDCKSYLGYDPVEGKHKVLCIFNSEDIRVVTLGGQESWRRLLTKGIPKHYPRAYGPCVNGVLYYEATLFDGWEKIIMSFDVKSESFSPIKYPKKKVDRHFGMIPYQGRLALVSYSRRLSEVNLYVLKDARGDEWTHQVFVNIICKSRLKSNNPVIFKGVTDDGELVFAPSSLSESYCVIYFDPISSSTREALFEGVESEIRRSCGIATSCMHVMDVFSNHIQSVVSL